MSASFYDLQKYAATGQASHEMTGFDKMRALAMAGGGKVETLTGIPPLSFRANGKPLISLSMLGNTQQQGTPSPQSIILPTFCGKLVGADYVIPIICGGQTVTVPLGQTQTVRRIKKLVLTGYESEWSDVNLSPSTRYFRLALGDFDCVIDDDCVCSHFVHTTITTSTTGIGCNVFRSSSQNKSFAAFRPGNDVSSYLDGFKQYLAAQYAAGTPVTIWYVLREPTTGIVNEPLCKIGDYADELHSEDAAVTIPTAKGDNTLTVDTDLQPSEMTITYRG